MKRQASPLDAFFVAAHAVDVVRAAHATATLSRGEVVSPDTTSGKENRPEKGGVFCQRIFGPVKDGRCACGYLGGERGRPPASAGERCPKCQVEATSSSVRNERWGHVSLPAPVVHPACIPTIAQITGLSVDEVRAIARQDPHERDAESAGAALEGLRRRLKESKGVLVDALRAEDLLIDRVPVTPPGDRPLVRMPGGHDMPDARTRAYVDLVAGANRLRRLTDLGAPEIVLGVERCLMQSTFERLLTGAEGAGWADLEDDEETNGDTLKATTPASEASWISPPDPTRPVAAAFAGEGGLLLQFPDKSVLVDLEGVVHDAFATPSCKLLGLDEEGRFALFRGPCDGLHVRDLRERAFVSAVPASFPAAFMREVHEAAFLVDARRRRHARLREVSDYPVFAVLSPDGRHLWVEDREGGGGIYGVETGLCEVMADALRVEHAPTLCVDGRLDYDVDVGVEMAPEFPNVRALVLAPHDRFRIVSGRVISENDTVLLALAPPQPVVAFSRSGDALLVVRRDHATIVDLDPPRSSAVRAHIPLGHLVT